MNDVDDQANNGLFKRAGVASSLCPDNSNSVPPDQWSMSSS